MDQIARELLKVAKELVGGGMSRSKFRNLTRIKAEISHIREARHWGGGDYDDETIEEMELKKELKRGLGSRGEVMSKSYAIDIYSDDHDEVRAMAKMDDYELSEYMTEKLGHTVLIFNPL